MSDFDKLGISTFFDDAPEDTKDILDNVVNFGKWMECMRGVQELKKAHTDSGDTVLNCRRAVRFEYLLVALDSYYGVLSKKTKMTLHKYKDLIDVANEFAMSGTKEAAAAAISFLGNEIGMKNAERLLRKKY